MRSSWGHFIPNFCGHPFFEYHHNALALDHGTYERTEYLFLCHFTYPSGTDGLPFMFASGNKRFSASRNMAVAPFCPSDPDINENRQFKYVVFVPSGATRFNRAIILLHGLNDVPGQYLSWAEDLVRPAGCRLSYSPSLFT